MSDLPSPTDFAGRAGISVPYASQILSGARAPSRALAITIYRRTGRKFGPIAALSDEQIDFLEKIEADAPKSEAAA